MREVTYSYYGLWIGEHFRITLVYRKERHAEDISFQHTGGIALGFALVYGLLLT